MGVSYQPEEPLLLTSEEEFRILHRYRSRAFAKTIWVHTQGEHLNFPCQPCLIIDHNSVGLLCLLCGLRCEFLLNSHWHLSNLYTNPEIGQRRPELLLPWRSWPHKLLHKSSPAIHQNMRYKGWSSLQTPTALDSATAWPSDTVSLSRVPVALISASWWTP